MNVSDLMQREVATLNEDDHLDLADDIMRLGRIRHLPVVAGDRVVGIVSQRDLYRAAVSSVLRMQHETERSWLASIPVRDVMARDVTTAAPSTPIRTAVGLMLGRQIGCLPIVEGNNRLVGLLSESDCLGHLVQVLDLAQQRGVLPEIATIQ